MITDREYPATHSMSTAWYVVDDEGNVGLMDYQDNGPVPWDVPEDEIPEGLIYGYWKDWNNGEIIRFNLTEEQILELYNDPVKPHEVKNWYHCALRIDKSRTERFLELCKNKDIGEKHAFCVSESLGLYDVDLFGCADYKGDEIEIYGTLRTMLEENLILEVYEKQNLELFDRVEPFSKFPYFIFEQDYPCNILPEKFHSPEHPVKIEQVPECFRHRIHRIPGSFKKMDSFQIAQYYPCAAYSNQYPFYSIDGCGYERFPLSDGKDAYMKEEMDLEIDFSNFCSEKENYHCNGKCGENCCHFENVCLTDKPTVLIIYDPREWNKYYWKSYTDMLYQNAFITPYIPHFPCREAGFDYPSEYDVKKYMTDENVTKFFNGSKGYLEMLADRLRPNLVILTNKAYCIFKKVFQLEGNMAKIGEDSYPVYSMKDMLRKHKQIEGLALMPYKGKSSPQVISLKRMDELVKSGKAI